MLSLMNTISRLLWNQFCSIVGISLNKLKELMSKCHKLLMTLILKLYLDMVKMQHHTKNEVNCFKSYSPNRQTNRQTDRMETLPLPHMREVKMTSCVFSVNVSTLDVVLGLAMNQMASNIRWGNRGQFFKHTDIFYGHILGTFSKP